MAAQGVYVRLASWFNEATLTISDATSLPGILGVSAVSIITMGLGLILVLLWILPKPSAVPNSWSWRPTGLALAALGTAAWIAGSPSHWHWGLSLVGPSRTLLSALLKQTDGQMTWGAFMLLGIPLGSFLSARAKGAASWQWPRAREFPRRFLGGLLMGVGGTLAAGCNIGNALTGLSVLSVNSLLATVAIVLGLALAVRVQGFS